MIHASDTDVLVITMAAPSSMSNSESLVAFIHGDTLCYIHIIRACLGDAASQGLLYMLYQIEILGPHSMALAETARSVCKTCLI